jgi:hypothetical protein
MRVGLVLGVLLAACRLKSQAAPPPPALQPCPPLDQAVSGTRRALDEGRLRPFGLVVEQLLVRGELSDPLRGELDDIREVEDQLEGSQIAGVVGEVIKLIKYRTPRQTIALLGLLEDRPDRDLQVLADGLEFVAETAQRRAVITPLRTLFVACQDGRDVAGFLATLFAAPGACEGEHPALRCLIDDLVVVLADPQVTEALRALEFDGAEGRQAALALIKAVMNTSAQPSFDPAALRGLVGDLFAGKLTAASLAAIDRLLLGLSLLLEDEIAHGHWRGMVLCVERHDTDQRLAGLTIDLLLSERFSAADFAELMRGVGPLLSEQSLLDEWADYAGYMLRGDSSRARVIGALRPLLTPAVFGYLAPTAIALLRDGVVAELLNLVSKGLSCRAE